MAATRARYDGHADWYEEWNRDNAGRAADDVARLLGPGTGLCLDLGCGGGCYAAAQRQGRRVAEHDVPGAAPGEPELVGRPVQADHGAARRGQRFGCLSAVAAIWISTDADDFTAVLAEAARVLAPGGLVAFHGAHPCFNGPHVEWLEDGGVRAHPVCRRSGWHPEAPWWGTRVRRRVGMRQHTLAELLTGFIRAGLVLEHVAEQGREVPHVLSLRARKAG